MNPLDKEELSEILKIINNDMPKHTLNSVKIKGSYSQGMPKNLMEYSEKIDNKFLNDNLHIIEEMEYRQKGVTNDFKEYQNKIYGNSEILNHDNFFKAKLHDSFFKYQDEYGMPKNTQYMRGINIQNVGFLGRLTSKVYGADMVTNLGESGTSAIGGGPYTVIACKVKTTGVVNQFYDRVAINVSVASGNLRLCAYKDNAGSPDARYVTDTGSFAAAADYAWRSLTEFSLTTAANWLAFSQSAASVTYGYENQASGNTKYLAGTFGQLADPIAAGLTNSATVIQMKLGHS